MFDLCWGWRRQLLRRTDGELPRAQLSALEAHLERCEACRAYAETGRQADRMLRAMLSASPECEARGSDDGFQDAVLMALYATPEPSVSQAKVVLPSGLKLRLPAMKLNLDFLGQIMGGALTAAALTILCIVPALHAGSASTPGVTGTSHERHALSDTAAPPVPLESLLRSPSPRAAMMWTVPAAGRGPKIAPRPASARQFIPATEDRHGMRASSDILG